MDPSYLAIPVLPYPLKLTLTAVPETRKGINIVPVSDYKNGCSVDNLYGNLYTIVYRKHHPSTTTPGFVLAWKELSSDTVTYK
jgi:hypothetical protein